MPTDPPGGEARRPGFERGRSKGDRVRRAWHERVIAVGVPARVIEKRVDDDYVREWTHVKGIYEGLAGRQPEGLR